MKAPIPGSLLAEFTRFLSVELGITLDNKRSRNIEACIFAACEEFGIKDPGSCIRWLMSKKLSKKQVEILASFITVGESYFFRQPEILDLFETVLLPALVLGEKKKEKRLRTWSAACSSGEEPYTLAIILDRQRIMLQDWDTAIYASDINKESLEKAGTGIYSNWKLRNTPTWARNRCFIERGKDRFEILPHLKKMVHFDYYNLVADDPPGFFEPGGSVDIILCCNVLMYFSPREVGKAFDNLYRHLSAGGFFIFAHTDIAALSQDRLDQLSILKPGSAIFRKPEASPGMEAAEIPAAAFPGSVSLPEDTGTQGVEKSLHRGRPEAAGEEEKTGEEEEGGKEEKSLTAARALYETGRYSEAIALLHKLLDERPGQAGEFALLARAYADSGAPEQALEWCEKAVAAERLNIEYRYLQANISEELGKNRDAVKALKECLYLDPLFIPAHFSLGAVSSKEGDTLRAVKHFKNALSLLTALPREAPVPGLGRSLTVGRMIEISAEMIEKQAASAAAEGPGNSRNDGRNKNGYFSAARLAGINKEEQDAE